MLVRSDLSRGTVTLVFTDISGSTMLLRKLGRSEFDPRFRLRARGHPIGSYHVAMSAGIFDEGEDACVGKSEAC